MSHHASLCMPWTAVVPNSGRSMTTSSFDGTRCNRISPSAVLDDRLDGKDLEWARDHLRRCEACRDRVEDFREMLLRVGRLPSAPVGAAAMDQAFAVVMPDRLRAEAGSRAFAIASPGATAPAATPAELPAPMRPEVSSVPDLLIELERESFRDEPGQDHPTPLTPIPESTHPTMAAACVLLAAVLYEGGWLSKGLHNLSLTSPAATASLHPSPSASPRLSASPSSVPSLPPAPVLFTLGNGVSDDSVFRIRPGTAVAGYTRLVFDMHGGGLPTMVISRPDEMHVAVTFKAATVTGVPVNGIHSSQVAGIEPAVQQGPDGTITIDLTRPVRVTAFTLPATGGYSWRLVVDLHTS